SYRVPGETHARGEVQPVVLNCRSTAHEAGADGRLNACGITKGDTIVEVAGVAWPHQHGRRRIGEQSISVWANPVSSNQRVCEAAILILKWLHCFIPNAHTEAKPATNLPVVLRIG